MTQPYEDLRWSAYFAQTKTATIANAATASDTLDLNGVKLVAVEMPAAFDGTTITFKASAVSAAAVAEVRDKDGVVLTLTVAASRYVFLDPTLLAGVRYLQLVAGTAQTAQRLITLVCREV